MSDEDIRFVLTHGEYEPRAGVLFCQLHRKNVPEDTPGNHRHWQLVGTTIVLCTCGVYVVTLYRQAKAFRRDKRKTRYNRNEGQLETCPCCRAIYAA
jgi:hypothetical protein